MKKNSTQTSLPPSEPKKKFKFFDFIEKITVVKSFLSLIVEGVDEFFPDGLVDTYTPPNLLPGDWGDVPLFLLYPLIKILKRKSEALH